MTARSLTTWCPPEGSCVLWTLCLPSTGRAGGTAEVEEVEAGEVEVGKVEVGAVARTVSGDREAGAVAREGETGEGEAGAVVG